MTSPFRVYVVTYNVGDTDPPKSLVKLLGLDVKELPNLYAIGIQELRTDVTSMLADAVYDDPWTNTLTDCLCQRNYVRIKSVRLLGLHLVVFIKRSDLAYVCNVQAEITRTGLNGLWGNKGGISIRMDISGVNVCFVNCHLAAHLEKVTSRIEDFDQIVENQTFYDLDVSNILDHDYIFWMGDLNFRLDDISKDEVEEKIREGDLESLWKYDQLKKLMRDQLIFIDFEEGPLTFPPTFKFDKGTDVYDTSAKKRKPGWCDRVLWMVHEDAFYGCELATYLKAYHSIPDYKESDHKPVVAEFTIMVLVSPPELPVMFEPMETWLQSKDQRVCYCITPDYTVNSRDWIGLYRTNTFRHPFDYKTYMWASTKADNMGDGSCLYEVMFDSDYFRDLQGTFCLCYYSYKRDCFIGYSDTFQISVTDESSSDSSDSDWPEMDEKSQRKFALSGRRKNRVSPAALSQDTDVLTNYGNPSADS